MRMKELSKEIIRQAEKEAEKIIKNAKKEAEALIEKAKAEAKQEIEKERKKTRKEKERLLNREKIKANIEGKKLTLDTKKEVLERVFQEFLKKVLDMKEKEKTELYRSLVKNAEKEIKSGTIYVRKQDLKIVKKLAKLRVMEKDMEWGITAESRDGKELIDLTLPTLIEFLKERTAKKLADLLFGEKDEKGKD
ncbi:MAG: hypothetical protein DRP13_04140 [Candidatus Aenigmatarchaeota archaeon]|nr:MAG: hypothetical protein DRP13_04140 [Candidatus Aenigmarchaeota archaeon]